MQTRDKKSGRPANPPSLTTEPHPFPIHLDDLQEGAECIGFDWKYLYLNQAAAARYGQSREDLLDRSLPEINPEEETAPLIAHLRTCMHERTPQHFAYNRRSVDGASDWYECSAYPSAEGIFVLSRQHSRVEPTGQASARSSEERYYTLFNSIDEGCCIIELIFDEQGQAVDYRFLEVNASFERQTGLRDVIGKRIREIIPQNEGFWYKVYGRVALTGEPVRFQSFAAELRRWYDIYAFRFGQPEDRQVAILFSDISERRRAEEALRLENERFLRFLDSNLIGIVIAGADSKIILANDYYLNILGATWEDFPGGKVDWRKYTPPEWLPADEKALRELADHGVCEPYEKEYIRKDGTRVPVYIADAILPGPERQIAGFVLDITERKRAEEELRQSRDRLAELSRRLGEAYEDTSRAIGRELHDEIGQMLTVLKLSLGMIPQLPPEAAAHKLAQSEQIVTDLMARTSALSIKLRSPILDDFGLLPALIWQINRVQEQSDIVVALVHSGIEGCRFDSQVEYTAYRLVQEALTNIARHSQGTKARLEIHVDGQELKITLEDDGIGFDPAPALGKRRGLSGMHERIELVHGSLQIQSRPGQGTSILARLPL